MANIKDRSIIGLKILMPPKRYVYRLSRAAFRKLKKLSSLFRHKGMSLFALSTASSSFEASHLACRQSGFNRFSDIHRQVYGAKADQPAEGLEICLI